MERERKNLRTRGLAGIATLGLAVGALGLVGSSAGGLTAPDPAEVVTKVTICHRTNSNTNPYVINTPDASGVVSGHAGHTGPVWNDTLKAQKIKWGDIIPPFKWSGGDFAGLNWDTTGQAFYTADCATPPPANQAYGSLSVTKTVVAPAGTPLAALPTSFTVHVECDEGLTLSKDLVFAYAAGTSTPQVIDKIESGSECVITEKDTAGFPASTAVTITPGSVVIATDTAAKVDVKNDFAGVTVEATVEVAAVQAVVGRPAFTG